MNDCGVQNPERIVEDTFFGFKTRKQTSSGSSNGFVFFTMDTRMLRGDEKKPPFANVRLHIEDGFLC